jgi:hypothetical protein
LFTNDVSEVRGLVPAPAGLIGTDPTRTIEVWAFNPAIADEETMVAWSRRGGPDGSNVSFNYGQNGAFGAVGHWGAPDIGWNNVAGNAPPRAKWHHLVYTYDGTTTRVYTNGALANMEVLAPSAINTAVGAGINLAAQFDNATGTVTGGLRGSVALGRVRIHDGVLSDAQILNNYTNEVADFIDPDPALAFLASPPTHRYSFNEAATNDAAGLMFLDSIGTAHGLVQGVGAQFSGSRLLLPGGSSTTNAYGDLPNGLLSINSTNNGGTGEVSLEAWVRVTGGRTWSRIFDFGSRTGGEVTGPGGTGTGLDYLFYSAQINNTTTSHRMELANNDPAAHPTSPPTWCRPYSTPTCTGRQLEGEHRAAAGLRKWGQIISTLTTNAISDINDVNVWLGRSQFDPDQNMQGEFDEFRIYNHVLSQQEINAITRPGRIRSTPARSPSLSRPNRRTWPCSKATSARSLSLCPARRQSTTSGRVAPRRSPTRPTPPIHSPPRWRTAAPRFQWSCRTLPITCRMWLQAALPPRSQCSRRPSP